MLLPHLHNFGNFVKTLSIQEQLRSKSKGLSLSLGLLACVLVSPSCGVEEPASVSIQTEINHTELATKTSRANPPYFPLANGCTLPELSTEMEHLQSAVCLLYTSPSPRDRG